MNGFLHKKRSIFLRLLSGMLTLSFVVAPLSVSLTGEYQIQKAHALDTVWDPGNWVANYGSWIADQETAISTAIQAGLQESLNVKEYTLDAIAWALVNLVVKEMIKSTTRWVASGFQGSPAFITDLNGFLLDIGDRVAGNFIYGAGLQFLCSPFKLDIQIALELQYNRSRGYEAKCRLSSVIDNIENFLAGDFMSGGWEGWYDMTLVPENNRFGAYMEAQAALGIALTNEQGQQLELLNWGDGFLSQKDANGNIITPGNVIETQLNNALDMPGRRLAVADEINELVGTLFAQLVSSMLSSGRGLVGLGDAEYFDPLDNESNQHGIKSDPMIFENDIDALREHIRNQNTIISKITVASTYMRDTYPACGSPAGTLTNSLLNKLTLAQNKKISSDGILVNVQAYQTDSNLLGNANTPVAILRELLEKYDADSVSQAQMNLINEYTNYVRGIIPSSYEKIVHRTDTIPKLNDEISVFKRNINQACAVNDNFNDNNFNINNLIDTGG